MQIRYDYLTVDLDPEGRTATLMFVGPTDECGSLEEAKSQGAEFWPLAILRAFEDALLHLRFNELELGTLILKSRGDAARAAAHSALLEEQSADWFMREVLLFAQRAFKRLDVTSRTTFAFVESGSCFTGILAELLFAVDRSYMLDGQLEGDRRPAPTIEITAMSFGPLKMANGLTRLETRFIGEPESMNRAESSNGKPMTGREALEAGLITFAPDDIDWEDEIRLLLEERASFSPDALTGMEANLRFAGPETTESKIFGRLSAWQNWIFQRPNAVGEEGALKLYGTGRRAKYDRNRV